MKRDTKEIKIWLIRNELRQQDIVEATGEEQTYVNKTILGLRNNRVVLQWLKDNGCPVDHLALPEDMREAV